MFQVIISEGATWAEQRRFTLRTLRDFGFGKVGMEDMIAEEAEAFMEEIRKSNGEPFDFMNKFNLPILNSLWRVTVGERFKYDDPRLLSIVTRLTQFFKRLGKPETVLHFSVPWMRKIFPKFLERDQDLTINHDIVELMLESIREHEASLDPNDPRDFTDKVIQWTLSMVLIHTCLGPD